MNPLVVAACGFAFSKDLSKVALQLKSKPAFCKGKLNGPGGKFDPARDESILGTMAREFEEETGFCSIAEDWEVFHIENNHVGGMSVHFCTTNKVPLDVLNSAEDEPIVIADCRPEIAWFSSRPSMEWKIPPEELKSRTQEFYRIFRGDPFAPTCAMYNLTYLIPMAKAWIQFPALRYKMPEVYTGRPDNAIVNS